MLWDLIEIGLRGERNSITFGTAHKAFVFFNIDFEILDWQNSKEALQHFFAKKENVAVKVRVLLKVYKRNGQKAHKIIHIERINNFTE